MLPSLGLTWLSSITSMAALPMRNVLRHTLQRSQKTNVADAGRCAGDERHPYRVISKNSEHAYGMFAQHKGHAPIFDYEFLTFLSLRCHYPLLVARINTKVFKRV